MNSKEYQLDNYKKFLLNRVNASQDIIEYIENCIACEHEAAKHSFHKIIIHNWSDTSELLFDTMSEYFSSTIIPVGHITQGDITIFYTSSLSLIFKIIKQDFMFPFCRNMFNVDVLFNDKSSVDCFQNKIAIEEIVAGVVSKRFTNKYELDLSNICNDPEFNERKISFYKFSLLSHFKILMLRMGKDTKTLNLSNNKLSQAPLDVLNFFIKGDLIAINLSNNNIPSIQELSRVSSKIEKLWIEGNPLCDEIDMMSYVKMITMKFPRLSELDGIKLNEHGFIFPFFRNYIENPDRRTRMTVEKFLSLYFTHYDAPHRKKINSFYDINAKLTIVTEFTAAEEEAFPYYASHSRNILNPLKRRFVVCNNKMYKSRDAAAGVLSSLPITIHDPRSFTVDVLLHNKKTLVLVVDGIYKETGKHKYAKNSGTKEQYFHFRRTFVFNIHCTNVNSVYHIVNEIFTVSFATKEQIENSFKETVRNLNGLALYDTTPEDTEAITRAFTHITQLKKSEAELRLKLHSWDIKQALQDFLKDMRLENISSDKFIEDDDFSDSSSLMDDEID